MLQRTQISQRSSLALLASAALALPLLAGLPARAADPDVLKRQTVQIKVVREDAEPEYGSGVVLCQGQEDDLAYILTAHHVLYGKSQGGRLKLSRRDVKTTEIRFFKDLAPAILEDRDKGEDRISPYPVPDKDLALIVVTVPSRIPTAATGPVPSGAELTSGQDRHEFPVTAVGYAQESGQGWIERKGEMLRRESSFLIHSAEIEEGFSGGPLFGDGGALVGLNVQLVNKAANGDDAYGSGEGRTLAIDEILKSIDAWLPAHCAQSDTEDTTLRDAAFSAYKRAMREISLQRWAAAVPLLRDSIDKKFQEGGRVHLQGMRYTEYLPHYHLGLAYYKLKLYQEAYREFAVSDAQRVIRDDKRHRKLKKYKKDAYAKRNEEPPALAP